MRNLKTIHDAGDLLQYKISSMIFYYYKSILKVIILIDNVGIWRKPTCKHTIEFAP